MINLIASVSAKEIYNMDSHMYAGISIAISILSVLIGIIAIVAGVYGWMTFQNLKKRMSGLENLQEAKDKETDEEIKRTNKRVDKKLTELLVLKDDINEDLDEIKKNVFDTNVMNIINTLEISKENSGDFSDIISINLSGLRLLIPNYFNDLRIFRDYLMDFDFMLVVLLVNLNKIDLPHCKEIFNYIIQIRKSLKLERLDSNMKDKNISDQILNSENKIDVSIKKLEEKIQIQEKEKAK